VRHEYTSLEHVGRWNRLVAREFLEWLAAPPQCDWLDVGCGTGALSAMSLTEERRAALRERIRGTLPIAKDGSIDLIARAWAVRAPVAG